MVVDEMLDLFAILWFLRKKRLLEADSQIAPKSRPLVAVLDPPLKALSFRDDSSFVA